MKLSIVIAAYNEESNVIPLLNRIVIALQGSDYEIIYVDDGSKDKTAMSVKSFGHPRVKLIELRRNYGQSLALRAGIDAAGGDIIVTLDADLQNDPSDIPGMVELLESGGVDVVSGLRIKRKDKTISRKIPSLIANWLIRVTTGLKIRDFGCSLRVFRAEFARELNLYGEMHRFIPVLLHLAGARMIQVPVNHHPRRNGYSKYNISRTYRVVADLFFILFFNRFMNRPMHLFGVAGLFFSLIGIGLNIYLLGLKLLGKDIWGKPLIILAMIMLFAGIQFITIGILSEILMRTYYESQDKQPYLIRKITRCGKKDQKVYHRVS